MSRTIALDNTLRYLYNTLRKAEITVAIEFKYRGQAWRADTPDEARELLKQLKHDDLIADVEEGKNPEWFFDHPWTPDTVTDVLQNAGPNQKGLLLLLRDGKELGSHEIMSALGLKSGEALAGVLSGLSKQLKQMDLKPWKLYTVQVGWTGKQKNRSFRLVDEFRNQAEELGWPDGWKDYEEIKKRLKKG